MPKPEAFSRVLIDQALKDSGWDLLDERRVRFELDGKIDHNKAMAGEDFRDSVNGQLLPYSR